MTHYFFIAATMYLGWVLSPEALVLASNHAGSGAHFATLALIAACALSFWGAILTNAHPAAAQSKAGVRLLGTSADLAASIALVILMSTGMLVTAGFTFNETFVYWFPNFGFSATLLTVIVAIHMLGDTAVKRAQHIFSFFAVLSLCTIIVAGLLLQSDLSETSRQLITPAQTVNISLFCGSLFFFLGAYQRQEKQPNSRQLLYLLSGGAAVLILWQIVAIKHVPQEKLAESTIPYIFVAREVLGQTGRLLIGLTIISGTCGAVNYFMSMAANIGSTTILSLSGVDSTKSPGIKRLLSLIFAVIIALCMGSGLAGEPHLELYIYGALLLWLLSCGIQILASVLQLSKTSLLKTTLNYAVPGLFFFAFFYLIMTHEEPLPLVIFLVLALCLSSIITTALFFMGKKYHP
ncbi:MAG: hypothetical protein ACI8ZB_000556 [Desulforhopalus sp.]|jgi:hypothetical protein